MMTRKSPMLSQRLAVPGFFVTLAMYCPQEPHPALPAYINPSSHLESPFVNRHLTGLYYPPSSTS